MLYAIAMGQIKINIGRKWAWPRLCDLLFKFPDPPDISQDTSLKVCMQIGGKVYTKPKMTNRSKGAWLCSRDLLFIFCDPLISLERLKMQTSNFANRFTIMDTKPKNEK